MIAVDDSLPPADWTDYTLILPAISVGNVGQLAVDLLLATLDVEHVLYVTNPTILPVVGNDPFHPNSRKICTNWEVYQCTDRKLVIMQQRSSVIKGKERKYLSFLIDWIKEKNFKMVVMLSSCFSQYYAAEDLAGIEMHYLLTSKASSMVSNKLKDMQWQKFDLGNITEENQRHMLPGGGLTNSFHTRCENDNIPLIVVVKVCWEGDNSPEAVQVADSCARLLFETEERIKWIKPHSWCLPFGSPPNPEMY